ncbi:fimbrial protein [Kluyvera sp. STS39-E]|uniref:fimbrial protein n=1 Tax=Kluyvera sp. STS39-E TaxID=3234748 RepID=UPI0034C5CF7F
MGIAQNIDIDFKAQIVENTCLITLQSLNGSQLTGGSDDTYTLTIPSVGLDKIIKGDAAAQADFKFVHDECSSYTTGIITKIQAASVSGNLVNNTSTRGTPAANIGIGFKRRGSDDSGFIKPDNTTALTWTSEEFTSGLEMTAALRETTPGSGSAGSFDAQVIFNFIYQ